MKRSLVERARGRLRRELGRARTEAALRLAGASRALPAGTANFLVGRNEHGIYCIPMGARNVPAARWILRGEVWEPATLELLCASDPSGDIVHAGAFFGDALPALARSRSEATVWAFEPNPENHRCAQLTVLANGLGAVRLQNAALGRCGDTATLQIAGHAGRPLGGRSHLVDGAGATPGHIEVQVVAIDEALDAQRRVAAIHLDVEGQEQAALEGALATIERCRPLLVVEELPQELFAAALEPLGYRKLPERVSGNVVLRCG